MDELINKLQFLIPSDDIPRGAPLVVALHGFSDAGNVVTQLQGYFEKAQESRVLYEFPNDEYLDYRARRPTITFETDQLKGYDPQKLALYMSTDELGAPYFLLSGYEPDFGWEKFIHRVGQIVEALEVEVTVWTHAIPMPVPHTRPIGVTVSGNRIDLIESRSIWKPTTRLSASVGHVLEYSLYERGSSVAGFALLVPHYLANTDYPEALKVALECFMDATGLLFSTESTALKQLEFRVQVDEQVSANEESKEMVRNLETRYDDFIKSQKNEDLGSEFGQDIPTGEQLADDFEKFLAEQWPGDAGDQAAEDSD